MHEEERMSANVLKRGEMYACRRRLVYFVVEEAVKRSDGSGRNGAFLVHIFTQFFGIFDQPARESLEKGARVPIWDPWEVVNL